jgi:lipoprotein NlpD
MTSALVLGACAAHKPTGGAPVEDRTAAGKSADSIRTTGPDGRPLPGIENAGKPGYYTVRPGDTLIRIALETGQNWRDVARWNGLDNPNVIEVGQVLRIIAPTAAAHAATATAAAAPSESGVVTRPVTAAVVVPTPSKSTPTRASTTTAATAATTAAAPTAAVASSATEDEISFVWPGSGALLAGFDESKNKGLDLDGKPGDPVLAAAPGRVVYAGSGLRGYGNLVILKHNNTFLTAYAHNQILLVKEDQTVKQGQKIAEMGNSDADRPKLHFEIRRMGKPVDPAKYLPAR